MMCTVFKFRGLSALIIVMLLTLVTQGDIAYSDDSGNSVKILSPKNGEKVGGRIVVSGKSNVKDGSHIWVLAHVKLLQDQWWPQPKPTVDEKGNWQAFAYIGKPEDIGLEFEIAVATFNKESEAKIMNIMLSVKRLINGFRYHFQKLLQILI